MRYRFVPAVFVALLFVGFSQAADLVLVTATGVVEKVDKNGLTILPRGDGGRFEQSVTLKITGTTNLSQLTSQKRGGKDVLVQNEVAAKNLKPKQAIAVIYTKGPSGHVLLAAVVQPLSGK